jgi:hypothetical protein
VRTDEEAEEARRRRFAGSWPVVNKLVVILSEDVEHERVKAFVGSIAPRTGQTSPGKEVTAGYFVAESKQDPRKTHNAPTLIFPPGNRRNHCPLGYTVAAQLANDLTNSCMRFRSGVISVSPAQVEGI